MNFTVTPEDLDSLTIIDSKFSEITIPATLSKPERLKDIFKFLKKNISIKKLSLCDDYLDPNDKDIKYFCRRIGEELPNLEQHWIRELKVDGRHGR